MLVSLQDIEKGRVRIEVTGARRSLIEFSCEGLNGDLSQMWKTEIELGDPEFDDAVFLRGDLVDALFALDASMRKDIALAARSGASLQGMTFASTIPGGGGAAEMVRRYARITSSLCRSPSLPDAAALIERLGSEPLAGVRRSLLTALQGYPKDEEISVVVAAIAMQDPDASVRLAALELLPPARSREVFAAMVRDERLDPAARGDALRRAARILPKSATKALVAECVDVNKPDLCLAALETALVVGWRPPHERVRLFATTKWIPEIQAAAARLLDASDEPSAVILMDLLESDAASLRRAAIEALGDTGALEAVETLLRMTGENALARTAIAKIQQREGGDRGALSVAVENLRVGALSVDEGPGAGALSPAETTELPAARRPRGQKT